MGVKAAEDFITYCHRCGKEFNKADVRVPTPKKGEPGSFWYLCLDCFESEGREWWAKCSVKYVVERR